MNFLVGKSSDKSSGYIFRWGQVYRCYWKQHSCKKIFYVEKCCKFMTFFSSFLAKTRKKFSRFAIEFFPRQPWNVTNGFAFVSLLPTSEKWLAMFLRFSKTEKSLKHFFACLANCQTWTANIFHPLKNNFSIKPKSWAGVEIVCNFVANSKHFSCGSDFILMQFVFSCFGSA